MYMYIIFPAIISWFNPGTLYIITSKEDRGEEHKSVMIRTEESDTSEEP